jgi:hypothetical protein
MVGQFSLFFKQMEWCFNVEGVEKEFYYIIVCTKIFCNGKRGNEKELNTEKKNFAS